MKQEEWEDVKGFEGKYSVSSFGKVWNNETNTEVAQVLSGIPQYKYVNLQPYEGKRKLLRVHRLVAEVFVDGWSEEYNIVDHIDRDKFNNHYSNLRWTDRSGNQRNMDSNKVIKGKHIKDFVLKYEAPNAAYSHLSSSLQSGLSEEDAIERYEKYLKYGNRQKTIEWEGSSIYLLDLCKEKNIDYYSAASKLRDGWDIFNVIYNINPYMCDSSFEIKGRLVDHWFPSKKYFSEVHAESLLKYIEKGMIYEDILKEDGKGHLRQTIRGIHGTITELCKHFGVSEGAVSANMSRKGMTLEEALFAPRQRVKKLSINGEYKSPKAWYEYFEIDPKAANSHKSRHSKSFKETFEYYGVDTTDMTISEV